MPCMKYWLPLLLLSAVGAPVPCRGQSTGYVVSLYETSGHYSLYRQFLVMDQRFANSQERMGRNTPKYLALLHPYLGPAERTTCCEQRPDHAADSLYERFSEAYWTDRKQLPVFTVRLNGSRFAAHVHPLTATFCACSAPQRDELLQIDRQWKPTGRYVGEKFVVIDQLTIYQLVPSPRPTVSELKRLTKRHFNDLLENSLFVIP